LVAKWKQQQQQQQQQQQSESGGDVSCFCERVFPSSVFVVIIIVESNECEEKMRNVL
jgi:hypothetical protein